MQPDDQRVDKETFRQIFLDHWDGFKNAYPSYNTAQYEEVVQKMLECGSEMGGYTEYTLRGHSFNFFTSLKLFIRYIKNEKN